MEFVHRKRNRLIDYDYSQQGLYFITLCSENKKQIFGNLISGGTPNPISVGVDAHIDPLECSKLSLILVYPIYCIVFNVVESCPIIIIISDDMVIVTALPD